ncbi:MAG: response regulator transcription factor [Clostridia bacterium]|nr:response regulator transcription factor [Clostridia bacterium]
MIRCIVIDDEKPARDEIKYLLAQKDGFEMVGEGENGVDAINLINSVHPDVIFCDINMPLLSGIEVAKLIMKKKIDVQLIFITAYDEHAIQAFELCALDYLLKPIRDERFDHTIDKITERLKNKSGNLEQVDQLLTTLKPTKERCNHLCLYREGLLYPVKLSEVIYIHAEEKMLYFHTNKGVFESNKALAEVEEILPEKDFFKCHRAYIININSIESIIPWFNRTYRVKLMGIDEEIPVSRGQTNKLKEYLNIL